MMWQIKHPPDFLLKSSFRGLVWEGEHCIHFISKFNLCLRCVLEELNIEEYCEQKKKVLTLEGGGMLMTVAQICSNFRASHFIYLLQRCMNPAKNSQ